MHSNEVQARRDRQRTLARSLLDEALGLLDVEARHLPHGVSAVPSLRGRPRLWDHARIIASLQDYVARHGALPTRRVWGSATQAGLPGYATVCQHFGSIELAYQASGMLPLRERELSQALLAGDPAKTPSE